MERTSKAYEGGLKRGDQILEVNNTNFENISHNKALEVLRGTTLLSITVKSNLLGKLLHSYHTVCLIYMPSTTNIMVTQSSLLETYSMFYFTFSIEGATPW